MSSENQDLTTFHCSGIAAVHEKAHFSEYIGTVYLSASWWQCETSMPTG